MAGRYAIRGGRYGGYNYLLCIVSETEKTVTAHEWTGLQWSPYAGRVTKDKLLARHNTEADAQAARARGDVVWTAATALVRQAEAALKAAEKDRSDLYLAALQPPEKESER